MGGGRKLAERLGQEASFAAVCVRRGLLRPERPQKLARILAAFERHGLLAGAVTIGAIRNGDRVAMRDERGEVTYSETGPTNKRTTRKTTPWMR